MVIDGYQRQTGGRTVVPLAGRRPSSIASALGGGLEMAGQALGKVAEVGEQVADAKAEADFQIAVKEKERRQAALAAQAAGRLASLDVELNANEKDLPEYGAPGSVGYAKARGAQVDKAFDTVLADIDDPEVRQRLQPVIDRGRAQHKVAAQDYEDRTFRAWQGDNVNTYLDTSANALRRNPDGKLLDEQLGDLDTMIGAMKLDGRNGPLLRQVGRAQLTTGYLDGLLEKGGFDDVTAILGSGKLDGVLPPEVIKQYGRLAESGKDAAERKAELDQAEQVHAAREGLKVLQERVDTDNPPSASEWNSAIGAGRAAGVPQSELLGYGKMASDAIVTNDIRKRPTPVLEANVIALRAKRDAGGISKTDQTRLDRGEAELEKRGGEAGARIAPMLKGGPEQRMAAMQQLAAMPLNERWRVADAAGDPKAAVTAALPPEARAWAVQGSLARGAKPEAYLPSGPRFTSKAEQEAEVDRVAEAWMGKKMWAQLRTSRHLVVGASLDLMAGRRDGWDPDQFRAGLNMVMGGKLRSDGQWSGGLGTVFGRKVELPDRWSQREFEAHYARDPFADAVNGAGMRMMAPDIKANFDLRFVGKTPDGNSHYNLYGPDEKVLLRRKQDGTFENYDLTIPGRP